MTNPKQKHRNEVSIAGVLARDPELRYTTSGKAVASFNVATTFEKSTDYHRCVAWEKQAEKLAECFRKGSFVEIRGRLQTRSYDKDGRKVYVTEVVASGLGDGTSTRNAKGIEVTDADIPF